jgi:hypothetical protein
MSYPKGLEDILKNSSKRAVHIYPVEEYCIKIRDDLLKSCFVKNLDDNNFTYSINIHDILTQLYQTLLENKICIICLTFSNGNKIYEFKEVLEKILYFKNVFEDFINDDNKNDVIIDLPLIGITDDYENMNIIINFINYGWNMVSKIHYLELLKLAKLDDYLLGVTCNYKTKLRDHLKYETPVCFSRVQYIGMDNISGSPKDFFDVICEICIILDIDIAYMSRHLYILTVDKYTEDFISSKFCEKLKIDDINSYNNIMRHIT